MEIIQAQRKHANNVAVLFDLYRQDICPHLPSFALICPHLP